MSMCGEHYGVWAGSWDHFKSKQTQSETKRQRMRNETSRSDKARAIKRLFFCSPPPLLLFVCSNSIKLLVAIGGVGDIESP